MDFELPEAVNCKSGKCWNLSDYIALAADSLETINSDNIYYSNKENLFILNHPIYDTIKDIST